MKQSDKKKRWVWILRILSTLCVVGVIGFIFQNSLEVAQDSGVKSEHVQQIVNSVASTVGAGPFSLLAIRKMAHFSEFAMLGFWMTLCFRCYGRNYLKGMGWSLFLGLLVAVLDETVQRYVPGRASSTIDVLIDFFGHLSGVLIGSLVVLIITGIVKQNENKKRKGEKQHEYGC